MGNSGPSHGQPPWAGIPSVPSWRALRSRPELEDLAQNAWPSGPPCCVELQLLGPQPPGTLGSILGDALGRSYKGPSEVEISSSLPSPFPVGPHAALWITQVSPSGTPLVLLPVKFLAILKVQTKEPTLEPVYIHFLNK